MNIETYNNNYDFSTWVKVITGREYMRYMKSLNNNKTSFYLNNVTLFENEILDGTYYANSTSHYIIDDGYIENIDRLIDDEHTKEILKLRHSGYKYSEIAKITTSTKAQINRKLKKSVKAIKKCLIH